jgi:hypothetical protein
VTIPQDAGTDLHFLTSPLSRPQTYWLGVNNIAPVDLQIDLSAKTVTQGDSPEDASNLVLTGGYINSLILSVSGYQGRDADNLSKRCAASISAGLLGDAATARFVQRRNTDPNAPRNECDAKDLLSISQSERNSFCQSGTADINRDDTVNPSFLLKRLSYKNQCIHQEDKRQCQISGQSRKCQVVFVEQFPGPCHDGTFDKCGFQVKDDRYARAVTQVRSSTPHPVSLAMPMENRRIDGGQSCGTFTCDQYTEQYLHITTVNVDDSTFYQDPSITSDGTAVTRFCEPFIDAEKEVEVFAGNGFYTPGGGSYALSTPVQVFSQPETINKLCSSVALETQPGRNVLEITKELSVSVSRQYQYSADVCPAGWAINSYDQKHFNPDWSEIYSCTKDNCPNSNLFYQKVSKSILQLNIDRGQSGAERGRAAVFAYEVGSSVVTDTGGQDGRSGAINIDIPSTTKYCADVRDLNNSASNADVSMKPSITLNEINFSAIKAVLPDTNPARIYKAASETYIYKRVDSSVRDWLNRQVDK